VLHKGHLVFTSSKDELLENYPVNAVSLELNQPPPRVFVDDLENCGWVERVKISGNKLSILARDVPQGKAELLPLIVRHGLQLEKYEWVRPSLEEIFLELSK
jgi:ABC-type multidrug transport system ATPase subunit